jgi:hypothetical protein
MPAIFDYFDFTPRLFNRARPDMTLLDFPPAPACLFSKIKPVLFFFWC